MAQKNVANSPDQLAAKVLTELGEMTLRKYLIHETDVKYCPSEGCQYAGFVKLNEDEEIACAEPLECENCTNKWIDPAQSSAHKISISRLRKRLIANSSALKTLITRTTRTTPCP